MTLLSNQVHHRHLSPLGTGCCTCIGVIATARIIQTKFLGPKRRQDIRPLEQGPVMKPFLTGLVSLHLVFVPLSFSFLKQSSRPKLRLPLTRRLFKPVSQLSLGCFQILNQISLACQVYIVGRYGIS